MTLDIHDPRENGCVGWRLYTRAAEMVTILATHPHLLSSQTLEKMRAKETETKKKGIN